MLLFTSAKTLQEKLIVKLISWVFFTLYFVYKILHSLALLIVRTPDFQKNLYSGKKCYIFWYIFFNLLLYIGLQRCDPICKDQKRREDWAQSLSLAIHAIDLLWTVQISEHVSKIQKQGALSSLHCVFLLSARPALPLHYLPTRQIAEDKHVPHEEHCTCLFIIMHGKLYQSLRKCCSSVIVFYVHGTEFMCIQFRCIGKLSPDRECSLVNVAFDC